MKAIRDTSILFGRSMRHIMRSPDTIITVAIIPIMIMLMFVYVLGGAIQTGTDNYVDYLLPGIILMAIASGIAYTAVRLFTDVQKGLFQRFHSMPISRSSVLWGHVLTSLVSNAISIVLIILVALFTLALTWVAVIPGFLIRSYFYHSSVLLLFQRCQLQYVFLQKITIVNTIRALLYSEPIGNDIWIALAWCVGITVVAYVFAVTIYKKMV
ncbi:Daunorubicin/doxorubicin resistance ABC transporter permease protein drrB [Listeria monocytogenes]|nr:Daunorubicin/doxorubicin resistance ABC transporter permease protein drrB [Listeria monocytogenes]